MLQKQALRADFGHAGVALLLLLLSQNLLRLPFLLLRRGLWFTFLSPLRGLSALFDSIATLLVYLMAMLVAITVALYLYRSSIGFAFPAAPVRRDYQLPAIGAGLGAAMLGNLIAMVVTALLGAGGVSFPSNMPSFGGGLLSALVTLFTVTVLPALLEEFLFRGALLQPLRKYGDRLAILVSALLFALCHPTLPQAINAFVMGLVLGVFTVRTGSLSTSVSIHLLYNLVACVTMMAAQFLSMPTAALLNYALMGLLLLAGSLCTLVLKKRFGRVWWVASTASEQRLPAASAALTSLPFVAALVLMVGTILHNCYIM